MLISLYTADVKQTVRNSMSKVYSFSNHLSVVAKTIGIHAPLEEHRSTMAGAKLVCQALVESKVAIGIEAVANCINNFPGQANQAAATKKGLASAGIELPDAIMALLTPTKVGDGKHPASDASGSSLKRRRSQ